ncbi:hypothetical protein BVG19_g4778 [[Candida] boidinii]|nr:hypothetical protein BVG19_g4778 [[Candida] boidinii]OWB52686.1 hypothetical protein B5S27_g4267 [[Candida] boidinii]OWB67977.1 hypothetical protein B5S30_g3347 [[Candida] boidinii]
MSLADQLSGIQEATRTFALDRKKRSNLHSISLIYDSNHAATQDYDSIYLESFEALERLETLDKRFGKFKLSIFSETSINIDRTVQSKEQNDDLNKTIDAFLSLLAPYWHLAISIKAAEWPLRRFQMNVHNSEYFLLSTLPYYDQPIFKRVLYVVTKLPPMFQWLTGFKKLNNKNPSKHSIIKTFNDVEFYNLYSNFLIDEIKRNNQYRKQLVFFVSMAISTLASLASTTSPKLSELVPLSLQVSGSLLTSKDNECKISAYTLLAVLSSAVPLSKDVILASIDTILIHTANSGLSSQAFICILKLYQTIQSGSNDPLPLKTLKNLPSNLLFEEDSTFLELIRSSPFNNSFICSYLRSIIINNLEIDSNIFNTNLKLSKNQLKLICNDSIKKVISKDEKYPIRFTKLFNFISNANYDILLICLKSNKLPIDNLEMILQTTLINENLIKNDITNGKDNNDNDGDEIIYIKEDLETKLEELQSEFETNKSNIDSFLYATKSNDNVFHTLLSLYFKSIQLKITDNFLNVCFNSINSKISFLLRAATSLNAPIKSRTYALKLLNDNLKKLGKKIQTYTILPILCTLLLNESQPIRSNASTVIKTIKESNNGNNSSKELLLSDTIFGKELSAKLALISPKDARQFISNLIEFLPDIELDGKLFHKIFANIVSDRKLGKIVLAFFASFANSIDLPSVKLDLITIIINASRSIKGSVSPSKLFEHLLETYISKRTIWFNRCEETGCQFEIFEKQIVNLVSIKEKEENAIAFLEKGINSNFAGLVDLCSKIISEILPSLVFEYQIHIVKVIVERGLNEDSTNSSITLYDPIEVLESISLSSELFVEVLKDCTLTQQEESPAKFPKRRRRSSASTRQAMKDQDVSKSASTHLKKVTLLLDVLDKASSKNNFKPSFELLKILFNILEDLETLGKDGKLPILYSQETLASCMHNVIKLLKNSSGSNNTKIDTSSIRADVVVSAIRSSDSPQVQNKLLLVISSLASMSPELILHSVMPIFTFMGAHTIRQDDEFSSHVVEQTITCVVPALASAAESGMVEEVEFLLASFVGAFQHIPRHRRVRLFTSLAKTLGSQYSIHIILFLTGQQYTAAYAKHKMGECAAIVDFACAFLQNFTPEEQLKATKEYLDLWKLLPEDILMKDSNEFTSLSTRPIFGSSVLSLGKAELFNLRKGLILYIRHALVDAKTSNGTPRFRLKIATLLLKDKDPEELLNIFAEVIEHILEVIDSYQSNVEEAEILNKFYKLLGDVLALLPIEQFIKSISKILNVDKISESQLRTIKYVTGVTSTKFELEHIDDPYAENGASILIPILLKNIESERDIELSQASLDSIANLIQKFTDKLEASLLLKVLGIVTSKSGLLIENSPEVVISSINCITSIIFVVGVKMIGYFPKVVPPMFKIFEKTKNGDDKVNDNLIQISIIALWSCLFNKMPAFLTPNLSEVLQLIFESDLVSSNIRSSAIKVIVDNVDSKTLLLTICSLFPHVSQLDASSIGLYILALEMIIESLDKKTAVKQANVFVRFLLQALEYRAISKFDNNTIHRIEASIYNCAIQYVMKLNDKSFRPLFASVCRWAFDGEGSVTSIDEIDRMKSFFKFFTKLQESLRSIITSYYSYLLDSTEELLNKFVDGSIKDINLRRLVLISLTASFKSDQDEYWQSQARYETIVKALTSQFANVEDGIGKYLVKAVTSLVQDTSSSDEYNKMVNELIISHMRADCKPREKFWAVRTLKTIYKKSGEHWFSLLPQLVPIIAELLEDDDEDVEMEVRTGLAKVIEEVMGEPLDKYLD